MQQKEESFLQTRKGKIIVFSSVGVVALVAFVLFLAWFCGFWPFSKKSQITKKYINDLEINFEKKNSEVTNELKNDDAKKIFKYINDTATEAKKQIEEHNKDNTVNKTNDSVLTKLNAIIDDTKEDKITDDLKETKFKNTYEQLQGKIRIFITDLKATKDLK